MNQIKKSFQKTNFLTINKSNNSQKPTIKNNNENSLPKDYLIKTKHHPIMPKPRKGFLEKLDDLITPKFLNYLFLAAAAEIGFIINPICGATVAIVGTLGQIIEDREVAKEIAKENHKPYKK